MSRTTPAVARAALVLLAVVAMPACLRGRSGNSQETLERRLTEVLASSESRDSVTHGRPGRWLAEDPDRQVRALAAEILGRGAGAEEPGTALVRGLEDTDPLVRMASAHGLIRRAPERALEEAIRSGPEDPGDRGAWSASFLGEMSRGHPKARQAAATLIALATGSPGASVRARAVEALGRIGRGPARRVALRATEDADWEVRSAAAGALARLAGDEARPRLEGLAREDPHRTVRRRAAAALGEPGGH